MTVMVKVSAASARLLFTPCGPMCIEHNKCHGNCCDAPSRPGGCLVAIHKSERARIDACGGAVGGDGFLIPSPRGGCPFKRLGLCTLHGTGDKPFGCIASPFTLNRCGTLIVRNRYKLLPCYRGPGPKWPAYKAFSTSLDIIFGRAVAAEVSAHLDGGGGDRYWPAIPAAFDMLRDNDVAKRGPAHV